MLRPRSRAGFCFIFYGLGRLAVQLIIAFNLGMKVLVTGGSGYLGMHVRQFFSADDLSRASNLDILVPGDAAIAGDYDMVIHLAAQLEKSPETAANTFQTNVDGT